MGAVAVGMWLLTLCAYDIRQRRLPNILTMPGAAVILGVAGYTGYGRGALAGAAVLSALYLVVHLIDPRAMGAGDVKLALGLGGLTGAFGMDVWLLAAFGAPVLTAGWALVAAVGGKSTVPHGPSMCLASAAALALVIG